MPKYYCKPSFISHYFHHLSPACAAHMYDNNNGMNVYRWLLWCIFDPWFTGNLAATIGIAPICLSLSLSLFINHQITSMDLVISYDMAMMLILCMMEWLSFIYGTSTVGSHRSYWLTDCIAISSFPIISIHIHHNQTINTYALVLLAISQVKSNQYQSMNQWVSPMCIIHHHSPMTVCINGLFPSCYMYVMLLCCWLNEWMNEYVSWMNDNDQMVT